MIFIDANIFLAYFNEDDVHHARAIHVFDQVKGGSYGRAFTSDYVFNEVVGVALRKFGKKNAVRSGEWIIGNIPIINIDEPVFSSAWRAFTGSGQTLSLVDWTNLIVMKLANVEHIATFDKAFGAIEHLRVIR